MADPPNYIEVIGYDPVDGTTPISITRYPANWDAPAYGGGGGYGSGAAEGPSDTDKQAGRILAAIANENQGILRDAYWHAIANYDVADEQSRRLTTLQYCQARREAGREWYAQQQKFHSVVMQLTDQAGNALYSSLFHEMREMLARADDMADAEILGTLRENIQEVENNLFEALSSTNSSRNDTATEAEQQLRQLMTDFAAQLNNIHPGLLAADASPTGELIIDVEAAAPAEVLYPGWINNKTWYADHKFEAISPTNVGLLRPANAAQQAWEAGLLDPAREKEAASSPEYWTIIQDESIRRTQ